MNRQILSSLKQLQWALLASGAIVVIALTSNDFRTFALRLFLLVSAIFFIVFSKLATKYQIYVVFACAILQYEVVTNKIPFIAKFGYAASSIIVLILCLTVATESMRPRVRVNSIWGLALMLLSTYLLIIGQEFSIKWTIVIIGIFVYASKFASWLEGTPWDEKQFLVCSSLVIAIYCLISWTVQNPFSLITNSSQGGFRYMGIQQSNPGRFVGISGDYEMVGILCTIGFIISTFLLRDLREWSASPLLRFLVFLSAIIEIVTLASTGSLTYIIFSLVVAARYFFQQDGKISSILNVRNAVIICLFAWISSRVIPGRLEARNLQNFSINDFQDLLVLANRSGVWNSIFSNDGWSPYAILGEGLPYPLQLFKTWPHNTFVTLWVISGILGMIAFLILFFSYLKFFIGARRCLPDWLRYCNYLFLTASFTTDLPRNPGVLFLLASTIILTINTKKARN